LICEVTLKNLPPLHSVQVIQDAHDGNTYLALFLIQHLTHYRCHQLLEACQSIRGLFYLGQDYSFCFLIIRITARIIVLSVGREYQAVTFVALNPFFQDFEGGNHSLFV
jgi:hypothetical protein